MASPKQAYTSPHFTDGATEAPKMAFALQGHTATEWKLGSVTGLHPLLTMAPCSLSLNKVMIPMGGYRFLQIKSPPSYRITQSEVNGCHLGWLCLQGTLEMSGDIYGHHNSGAVLLPLNGRGQGCRSAPSGAQDAASNTKNFPAQNVNNAKAENP